MAMTFAPTSAVVTSDSLVKDVFGRPVALADETAAEAKIPNGHVGLITNYRGFKRRESGQGRSARGAGGTIVDLSALARLPAGELPDLIKNLQDLNASLAKGEAQARGQAQAAAAE